MVKSILVAPQATLCKKSQAVKKVDAALLKTIQDLKDTLLASKTPGVGLSAPQIGVNQRVFVANLNFFEKVKRGKRAKKLNSNQSNPSILKFSNLQVFINPEIIWISKETNIEVIPEEDLYLEGCLSIPKIYALIKRPYKIRLKWQSSAYQGVSLVTKLKNHNDTKESPWSKISPTEHEAQFQGFPATLIQHEIDHLNGILFTDHALAQNATLYEDEKGELKEVVVG